MNNEWKDIPIFPGWKITGELGSGSSSQVYSIEMEQEGVRIAAAMKILSLSADVKERTWKELEILKILKEEKGVVSFDEYQVVNNENDESGCVLLRMEKMISLLEYSKGKVFTEKEIIEIGLELCRALAVCHEKGILHRDIKPSNLLFSKEQICMGDFSEAVFEGRIQQYQIPELKRKPEACTYMAPEYYKKGEYDKRSDLYSLGLVLYELLSGGRVPFLKKEGKI